VTFSRTRWSLVTGDTERPDLQACVTVLQRPRACGRFSIGSVYSWFRLRKRCPCRQWRICSFLCGHAIGDTDTVSFLLRLRCRPAGDGNARTCPADSEPLSYRCTDRRCIQAGHNHALHRSTGSRRFLQIQTGLPVPGERYRYPTGGHARLRYIPHLPTEFMVGRTRRTFVVPVGSRDAWTSATLNPAMAPDVMVLQLHR
jgi:hypothetical protein